MAKKDTPKRKSGKDLEKEYRNLLDKTKAMQKRLVNRAEELIERYPDVIFMKTSFPYDKPITVGQYGKGYRLTPNDAISIIKVIEQWLADQHPHQQLSMYGVEVVPESPVGERVLVDGKTGEAHKRSVNSVRIENPETKDKRDV